jgi:hypothetical protein
VREKLCISTTHHSTAEKLNSYTHPVIIKTKIAKSPKLNNILGFTQPHSQIQFCLFLGGGPLNFYYVLNKTFVDTSSFFRLIVKTTEGRNYFVLIQENARQEI